MPGLSATNTLSESYYLLLNYQALYDARAGFAERWSSTNKDLHVSARYSNPQGLVLIHSPHYLKTYITLKLNSYIHKTIISNGIGA